MERDYQKFAPNATHVKTYVPGSKRSQHPGAYRLYKFSGTWGDDGTSLTVPVKQQLSKAYISQRGLTTFAFKNPRPGITGAEAGLVPVGGSVMRVVGTEDSEDPNSFLTPGAAAGQFGGNAGPFGGTLPQTQKVPVGIPPPPPPSPNTDMTQRSPYPSPSDDDQRSAPVAPPLTPLDIQQRPELEYPGEKQATVEPGPTIQMADVIRSESLKHTGPGGAIRTKRRQAHVEYIPAPIPTDIISSRVIPKKGVATVTEPDVPMSESQSFRGAAGKALDKGPKKLKAALDVMDEETQDGEASMPRIKRLLLSGYWWHKLNLEFAALKKKGESIDIIAKRLVKHLRRLIVRFDETDPWWFNNVSPRLASLLGKYPDILTHIPKAWLPDRAKRVVRRAQEAESSNRKGKNRQ